MTSDGPKDRPLRTIHARAPLRINDIGGWTDTWFAGEGKVLNLAASPPVEVQINVFRNDEGSEGRVLVHAENYGESFSMTPERPALSPHPFLQQTIGSLPVPGDSRLEISIFSPVPAGISTGTSAAVCIALLGALDALTGGERSPDELAALAHRVETEKLGQQSGIQDQICASRGGVCYIHMRRYPQADVRTLELQEKVREELNRRICLVYLGRPHNSSALHEEVIALLEREKEGAAFGQLGKMKDLAEKARDSLLEGNLEAYGRAMTANNECQRALYSRLIAPEADELIRVAQKFRASGWKVNGAGGLGGSLTVLASRDDRLRRGLIREVDAMGGGIKVLPIQLSIRGLVVWEA